MFKAVLFIALCIFFFVECRPIAESESLTDVNHRVERSEQHAKNAMKLAGQMANKRIQAGRKGFGLLFTAAQQAITAGASIAAEITDVKNEKNNTEQHRFPKIFFSFC